MNINNSLFAEYASFRLTHQIFSRIGSDNDIETNASTFTVEVKLMLLFLYVLSLDKGNQLHFTGSSNYEKIFYFSMLLSLEYK